MANNSTSTVMLNGSHRHILPILIPVMFLGICLGALNIFAIFIILRSKELRRPANYPVISILLGATIQGLLTAPTYIFKRLDEGILHHDHQIWICDFYRLPYFLCGHILKVSLMLVSFDRLVAVKDPYRYKEIITKQLSIITITVTWAIVLIVDSIPFLPFGKIPDDEGCTYVPKRAWGISVISLFNIIPFIIIAINYLFIWRVAAKITFKDFDQQQSVLKSTRSSANSTDNLHNSVCIVPSLNTLTFNLTNSSSLVDIQKETGQQKYGNKERNSTITFATILKEEVKEEEKIRSHSSLVSLKEKIVRSHEYSKKGSRMLRLALEMKATKTSFMLLMVYVLCWGPLGIFYLIDNYCSNCISSDEERNLDRFVVKLVSFLSSVFLPLAYCWRTKEFRTEIFRFACKERDRKRRSCEDRKYLDRMSKNSLM